MEKKATQIFLIICLVLIVVFGGCARSEPSAPSPTPTQPGEPVPELILDSDGDGFSDWFEMQMDSYDPNVPNDRYIILFERHPEEEGLNVLADVSRHFFVEKGKVPPENIITLKQEEATGSSLKNAIEQVAKKADENDIVFLDIQTHGYTIASFTADEPPPRTEKSYQLIDEWLDKIEAKAVVVTIMACGSERALPLMKDGPCPRILFINTAGDFIGALGQYPNCAIKADIEYGNNDGYVSLAEIGNWRNNEPRGWKDNERGEGKPGDGYWDGKSWFEKFGFSLMSDTSNIAHRIYLTDYKIPS